MKETKQEGKQHIAIRSDKTGRKIYVPDVDGDNHEYSRGERLTSVMRGSGLQHVHAWVL